MKLERMDRRLDGIIGVMTDGNGNTWMTLEHSYDGNPKIPSGVYTCVRRMSPHFGYELFELIDVPGHDAIEIHVGNYNEDSHGCILVGKEFMTIAGRALVSESKKAFAAFMKSLEGVDSFQLTVDG